MPTFFESRQIVLPGDLLAEGNYIVGESVFKEDDKIFATRIGLVDFEDKKVNVIPLKAFYTPKVGDTVLGTIIDVGFNGWSVDIHSPYIALLRASDALGRSFKPQKKDITDLLDIGDVIIAKIVSYDRTHDPQLTVAEPGLGKVTRGQIVKVTPTKIPRLIGKKGSMISMIKKETGCQLILGKNGTVLVTGKTLEDEELALKAIHKIEEESHKNGLTDRILQMIIKEKQKAEIKDE